MRLLVTRFAFCVLKGKNNKMSAETASPARRPDRSRLLKNFYGLETPPVNSPDINNAPSMEPIAAPLETSSDPLDLSTSRS